MTNKLDYFHKKLVVLEQNLDLMARNLLENHLKTPRLEWNFLKRYLTYFKRVRRSYFTVIIYISFIVLNFLVGCIGAPIQNSGYLGAKFILNVSLIILECIFASYDKLWVVVRSSLLIRI